MTEKEFQKQLGVARLSTVRGWIQKGYLPGVSGRLPVDIPRDMPRPYAANGRTEKLTTLAGELLKAADLQRSVFPAMFPRIQPESFRRTLAMLVQSGCITVRTSSTGAPFLELAPEGYRLLSAQEEQRRRYLAALAEKAAVELGKAAVGALLGALAS